MTKELFSPYPASTLREQVSGRDIILHKHPHPRTDAQFEEYIRSNYFQTADDDEFREVVDQYPSGGHYILSAVTEGTMIRCTRYHSGVPIRHRNNQCLDATIQENGVPPGRYHVPRSQKVFPRISGTQTERLVLRYRSISPHDLSRCFTPTPVSNTTKSMPIFGSVRGYSRPFPCPP